VQEYHSKFIRDRAVGSKNYLTGAYLQTGYFLRNIMYAVPTPPELAVHCAFVEEPNEVDRTFVNEREKATLTANCFFAGPDNKIALDFFFLDCG